MKRKVTMKDIANYLNIDRSSVTKALNNDPAMSPKTIERVKEAAKLLGYRKDTIASSLQTGKNAVLGLILADFRRGIYAPLVESFQRYSLEHEYSTVLYYVNRHHHNDLDNVIGLLQQQRVSGATFISAAASPELNKYLADLLDKDIVVNTLDRDFVDYQMDRVAFDHYKAGIDLTEHLISLGHRNIAFVTYANIKGTPEDRLNGYKEAMRRAKLQEMIIAEDKVVSHQPGDEMMLAYHRINKIWDILNHPTAFMGVNDNFALGILHALKERHCDVPGQISVAGFDDLTAALGIPQITSMRSPMEEAGKKLAKMLIERIQGNQGPANTFKINYTLVSRNSTDRVER